MKLETKARYAFALMLYLAQYAKNKAVTLYQVEHDTKISKPYLEILANKLKKAGLICSVRGPGGGYKLAKFPSEINLEDIQKAVDIDKKNKSTSSKEVIAVDNLLQLLTNDVINKLKTITLENILKNMEEQPFWLSNNSPAFSRFFLLKI